jgi:hypothetical protein
MYVGRKNWTRCFGDVSHSALAPNTAIPLDDSTYVSLWKNSMQFGSQN